MISEITVTYKSGGYNNLYRGGSCTGILQHGSGVIDGGFDPGVEHVYILVTQNSYANGSKVQKECSLAAAKAFIDTALRKSLCPQMELIEDWQALEYFTGSTITASPPDRSFALKYTLDDTPADQVITALRFFNTLSNALFGSQLEWFQSHHPDMPKNVLFPLLFFVFYHGLASDSSPTIECGSFADLIDKVEANKPARMHRDDRIIEWDDYRAEVFSSGWGEDALYDQSYRLESHHCSPVFLGNIIPLMKGQTRKGLLQSLKETGYHKTASFFSYLFSAPRRRSANDFDVVQDIWESDLSADQVFLTVNHPLIFRGPEYDKGIQVMSLGTQRYTFFNFNPDRAELVEQCFKEIQPLLLSGEIPSEAPINWGGEKQEEKPKQNINVPQSLLTETLVPEASGFPIRRNSKTKTA